MSGLKGARVTIKGKSPVTDWYAEIDSLTFTPDYGGGYLHLATSGYDDKGKKHVDIQVDASLSAVALTRDTATQQVLLRLDVIPTGMRARVRWGVFSFGVSRKTGALLTELGTVLEREHLSTSIPIQEKLALPLIPLAMGDPKAQRNWTDEGKGWFVDTKIAATPLTVVRYIDYKSPAFLKEGVWLSFDVTDKPPTAVAPIPLPPTVSPDQLARINARNRADIKAAAQAGKLEPASSLLIVNRSVFLDPVSALNGSDVAQRTVTIRSVGRNGKLYEKPWRDNILGDGGVFAEFESDGAIDGAATIGTLSPSWTPTGVAFDAPVAVKVEAPVHVHVDPLVGGGAGIRSKLVGQTSAVLRASAPMSVEELGGVSTLLVKPDIGCSVVDVKLATDGKYVGDFGWTRVPQMGVVFQQPVGEQWLAPFPLVSGIPIVTRLPHEVGAPFRMRSRYGTTRLQPDSMRITADGIEVPLHVDVAFTSDSSTVRTAAEAREAQRRAIADYYRGAKKQCPKPGPIQVVIGDLEFGSRNDIIKWLKNSWSDLTSGPGDHNDLVRVVNNLGATINAASPLDEAGIAALDEVSGLAERNLGKNNAITGAVTSVTSTARNLIKKPGTTIANAPGRILRCLGRLGKKC